MKYLTLPNDTRKFAPVILGTGTPALIDMPGFFGPPPNRNAQFKLLDEAWDAGVRVFDCAASYGEPVVSEYLAARGRKNEAVIISKCCHPNQHRKRVTEHDMLSDLHDSLARMKTNHIDIYLLHRDNPEVPVGEIVEFMNDVLRQGKILSYGGSNWSVARIRQSGIQIDRLRVTGGGARSPIWLQIKSDIFGLPLCQSTAAEAGAVYAPDPALAAVYAEKYAQYKALRAFSLKRKPASRSVSIWTTESISTI